MLSAHPTATQAVAAEAEAVGVPFTVTHATAQTNSETLGAQGLVEAANPALPETQELETQDQRIITAQGLALDLLSLEGPSRNPRLSMVYPSSHHKKS